MLDNTSGVVSSSLDHFVVGLLQKLTFPNVCIDLRVSDTT